MVKMNSTTARSILEKLLIIGSPRLSSDDLVWDKHQIEVALKELTELVESLKLIKAKIIPASNTKSCPKSEHYMSRYKEGWNAYRAEVIKLLKRDL